MRARARTRTHTPHTHTHTHDPLASTHQCLVREEGGWKKVGLVMDRGCWVFSAVILTVPLQDATLQVSEGGMFSIGMIITIAKTYQNNLKFQVCVCVCARARSLACGQWSMVVGVLCVCVCTRARVCVYVCGARMPTTGTADCTRVRVCTVHACWPAHPHPCMHGASGRLLASCGPECETRGP